MKVYTIDVPDYYAEGDKISAYTPYDALIKWCDQSEHNGAFSDGYPEMTEAIVTADDGTVTRHRMVTEWGADYFIYDA